MKSFRGLLVRKLLKRYLGQTGLSMVEGIMGAGMLGAAALGFAELSKNSANSTASLETRYAKMDVEQSIRSAFMSTASCKCAFTGTTVRAGSNTSLGTVTFYDPTCGSARIIIEDDKGVINSTLKVENIRVKNVTTFGTSEVVGDLTIDWKAPIKGLSLKPSLLRNLRFSVDATGAVLGCGFVPESSAPTACGEGKICFNGKVATFTNAVGAPITTAIVGSDATGMLLWFQTPAGRITMMKFAESSGALVASRVGSWRPQFCYGHQPTMPYCSQMNFFGANQPNCAAPLYWTYNGSSANSASLTSGTVSGSFTPTRYVDGTWPFKDTSVLPCGY